MHCPNCGTTALETDTFCPNCGTGLRTTGQSRTTSARTDYVPPVSYSPTVEDRGRRIVAYLIDVIPMIFLALLHFLPIIGWMLYGFIHACYWLLRDINGASLGKSVMGGYVGSETGMTSTTSQRIIRNIPLAIPGLLGMIPLIGLAFEIVVAFFIFGGEALLLLLTGRRLGDRLAGTQVFRRS